MSKRNRKRKIIKPVIAAVVVVAVATGGVFIYKRQSDKTKNKNDEIKTDLVTRGDLDVSITGEASVEPFERYEIISMVSGDITSSPYNVGDTVKKDAILYQFDTSTAQTNIQKQEISLEQSKNNLSNAQSDLSEAQSKLYITAPSSGIISDLTIKKGESVQNGQSIAQIKNTQDLEVTLPFTRSQISSISIGQTATLSSSAHMSSVNGTVQSISSEPVAQSDGSLLYNVKISFTNPGSFTEGLTVGGEVNGLYSPGYGTVSAAETGSVKSDSSGTISQLNYSNGDYVRAGSVIATISSDNLTTQERSVKSSELNVKNAELSMKETKDSLDDYSIKSPISGTVITKNAKAGDTIDRSNSSEILMVVADISKLKFKMDIDELDVSSVKEGQTVEITCDALPGETFNGRINSISVEGTATNGVTTYSAEVIIDEPGNLRPSMNIDASVIVQSSKDTLIVPTADIKTAMGISYVFLKDETGTKGATESDFDNAIKKKAGENLPDINSVEALPDAPDGAAPPDMVSEAPQGSADGNKQDNAPGSNADNNGKNGNGKNDTGKNNGAKQDAPGKLPEAPEGYVVAIVETGISDDESTEILSGLSEGDLIQQLSVSGAQSNSMDMMFGGMGGGMGGAPGGGGGMGGGPSGGAPGGGGGMPGGR